MTTSATSRFDPLGRLASQWWPIHWTSPLHGETPRPISLFDLAELRGVVDTNRVAAGLDPIQWVGRTDEDPTFAAGVTPIRAIHFTQLQVAISDLWGVAELGPIPEFRAGAIVPGTRVISLRDPLDLRAWVERYEQARPDLAARVAYRYGVTPKLWPLSDYSLPESVVELWDAAGHSVLWSGSEPGTVTELRRIDTAWHRTDVQVEAGTALITPDPRLGSSTTTTSAATLVGDLSTIDQLGMPVITWPPILPDLQPNWTLEADAVGRITRILDGDIVVRRLAYDGLGRLRKWVDSQTWHVVGPALALAVMATSS